MAEYRYRGRDQEGNPVEERLAAASIPAVLNAAGTAAHFVHSVERLDSALDANQPSAELPVAALNLLTEQLGNLTSSGVPLAPALAEIARESGRGRTRALLERVQRDVEGGWSLEEALERQGNAVPALYLSLVRVGERTGNLPAILQQLSEFGQRYLWLRYRLQIALAYPLVLVVLMGAFLGFFVTHVMTQFESIYQSFDRELPYLTRVVLALGRWTLHMGFPLFGGLVLVLFMIWLFTRLGWGRSRWNYTLESVKLRIPLWGNVFRTTAAARFLRALSMMLHHGLPIIESLHLAGLASGSVVYSEAAQQAARAIAQGEEVGSALAATGVFRRTHVWMIQQGERSTHFPESLERLAGNCEQEAERMEAHSLSLVGPTAVAICGILVGIGVIACFIPVFEFAGFFTF